MRTGKASSFGIRDNHTRGKVADFLVEKIHAGSALSVVSALHRLDLLKDVVMNPHSNPSAPNIPKQEVTNAITAVTAFLDLVARK